MYLLNFRINLPSRTDDFKILFYHQSVFLFLKMWLSGINEMMKILDCD